MTLRFIAGATCPSCNEMDSIQGDLVEGRITAAECVACGWRSVNPEDAHGGGGAAGAAEFGGGSGKGDGDEAIPVRIVEMEVPQSKGAEGADGE